MQKKLMAQFNNIIKTEISKKEVKDSGMALTLIFLIIGHFSNNLLFFRIAIPVIIITMIYPQIYYPFSVVWYSLSHLLGSIMSRLILSIIFFIILTPIALIRRMIGKDSLQLKKFKKDTNSVMHIRNHTYSKEDLIHPY
jgi:hypothetical protein